MPKFRDIEKGVSRGREEDFDVNGQVVKLRFMPLRAGRDREIEALARRYVEAQNKAHPDDPPAIAAPKEPTYERAIFAATILLSTLDAEDRKPFFSSVDEILDPEAGLDRDRLALAFELQLLAQADFAPPGAGKLTSEQYAAWFERTATAEEGVELPFERSPRAMQRHFVRGMATAHRSLLTELLSALQEISRLRSEIASLRGKSGPGPSSPTAATSFAPSAPTSTSAPEEANSA